MSQNILTILPILLVAMSLTACKGSSSNSSGDEHQSSDFETGTEGRLVVSSADTAEVAVMNLQDGSEIERISLNNLSLIHI